MKWEQLKGMEDTPFKRITGVTLKTFRLMTKAVKAHDERVIKKRGNRRTRPFSCSVEDQILLTLMYYREYRTQFHIGIDFGISESAVSRTISRIENILSKIKEFKLPGKEQLSKQSHKFEVLVVDATESPIERPKKNSIYIIQEKRRSIQ